MGKLSPSNLSMSGHPVILDDTSLTVVHTCGKSGGTFSLPFGAQLKVPEACLGKKDTITCQVASPNTRWLTCPHHLYSYELVNSELYTLKSSAKCFKKNVLLLLPFKSAQHEFQEINVKGKWTDEAEWINVGFLVKELEGSRCVELELSRLGTFVVTIAPKTETFQVSKLGCLHQSRLMRHLTLRFPKKTIDQDIQCALQILPIGPDIIQLTKDQFPQKTSDLVSVTELIDVIATPPCTFRHPISIKLPLPVGVDINVEGGGAAATSEGHPDIAVVYKTTLGWELVESNYKFTRSTVAFDIKELTRYCVVQCVPGRHKKMKDAVTLLEGRHLKEKGEVCLFMSLKSRSWLAMVEIVSQRLLDTRISDRKAQGFTYVPKKQALLSSEAPARFSSYRKATVPRNNKQREEILEIHEGLTWLVDVDGDVKVSMTSDLRENNQLRYFSRLTESYRTFYFEPLENDSKQLEATINLIPMGIRDENTRNKLTFTFDTTIESAQVVEYLAPEVTKEETSSESKRDLNIDLKPSLIQQEAPKPSVSKPRMRELPPVVMKRLTQPTRPIRVPDRESKALSGKSLMTLARIVPEGLTLAVHLQLPDSTITGIGFDALSNNLNMSDVSYKILLYWKRKCKDKQSGAITQLTEALKEMNYPDIAAAILNCHQQHKEFTPECLSAEDVYGRIALTQ
nr:hypothetical protein BgiMline_019374 [Biomphalaria glabrata]